MKVGFKDKNTSASRPLSKITRGDLFKTVHKEPTKQLLHISAIVKKDT